MSPAREGLGYTEVLVLSALDAGARYGLEVMERTELSSGTVYPALRRMEAAGLVEAAWEDEAGARALRRPARRYYRMTPEGGGELLEARRRLRERERALGWAGREAGSDA